MSSVPESPIPIPAGRERLILWQRALPDAAAEADALALRKRVETRLRVAGGELIGRAGTSVCAAFDPLELDDVVDLALGLLHDAQQATTRIDVACALALGALISEDGDAPVGSAIDRAQLFANAAEPFELALDEAAHACAEDSHLFVRVLRASGQSAHVLDRIYPVKRTVRAALTAVQPARLPAGAGAALEALRELRNREGPQRIVLRATPANAALVWLDELQREDPPSIVLRLGPQAAALQPLGGLSLALLRAGDALQPYLDAPLRGAVERIAQGAALPRAEAVVSLRELLTRAHASGHRADVVLDRARAIDRASLAVIAEALQQACGEPVLWLTADEHENIPGALLRASGAWDEVAIEPLTIEERARIAEAALSLPPGSEVARRVARLGGDTALGVWAAARTLVGSGDLVRAASGAFHWRTRARHASVPVPIDALLTECAAGLEPAARRVLEALCIATPGADLAEVAQVAQLDGLSADAARTGIERLVSEGWIDMHGDLGPLQHAVCGAIRNGMPPARAAELHRFVADVLRQRPAIASPPSFASGLLAHHQAQGGRDRDAAAALLDAAQAATESGFERVAVRLAAVALKLDASSEAKRRAHTVARTMDSGLATSLPPPRKSTAPPDPEADESAADPRFMASAAVRSAIHAIVRGEAEAAESLIDTAVAAGWGRAGAQRLWSIAQLAKGEVPDAVRALKQACVPHANPGTRCREAIAASLILLEAGELVDAVRAALEALASARREHDARGERAALELLAGCYRALDRPEDAERIAQAASAPRAH